MRFLASAIVLLLIATATPADARDLGPVDVSVPGCTGFDSGGDMAEHVCVRPGSDCTVSYRRTTFIGTTETCIVP